MAGVTVVVMTRNRVEELLATLDRLAALPDDVRIVVVDNGSADGTADAVAGRFPAVELIALDDNLGVEARNLAVRRASTPYVAFNDDDSWWAPGSLDRVAALFDAYPTLGAITADVVVEPDGRQDPTSAEMRASPVDGDPNVPGVPVLGFLACATAVRRAAFLGVGGFERRLHFGGEEELLATDLAARGWDVRFVEDVVVHHAASNKRDAAWRRRRGIRNTLWYLWLRRPAGRALRRSYRLLRSTDPGTAARGLAAAAAGGWWVLREREVVPPDLEEQLRRLEPQQDDSDARSYR